ncbi:GDYXXLXY domain-containing protein [Stappia sp. BW2]|nr:GDYXXLXY domain-containing protein [Stappia sp. BW2]
MRWALLALIQLGLLSIPLFDRLSVQHSGTAVPLAVVPVDPRDLLRGDYVVINLAIGTISKTVPGADKFRSGDRVFVGLKSEGAGAAVPVLIARERAEAGDLAIAGTVRSVLEDEIRVDYGIDAFFLPEGEGLEIERMDRSRILLEVAVTEDGRSLPVNLLVDGKAFRSDAIF